jgi:hypothetical protein
MLVLDESLPAAQRLLLRRWRRGRAESESGGAN